MRISVLASLIGVVFLVPSAAGQAKKGKTAEAVVDGKTIGEWAKALAGKELASRLRAIKALERAGPEARAAVPALIELVRGGGDGIDATLLRPLAMIALSRMGEAAVPALTEALADKGDRVRVTAAMALGLIGPAARAAVPALTEALKDSDAVVRRLAAEALGLIGPPARTAAPRLHDLLEDPDVSVRTEAALALWRVAGDARGVPALAAAVSDKSNLVAAGAIESLGKIGTKAKEASAALEAALERKSPTGRLAAAETLYRISGDAKKGLPVLLAELRTKDRKARLRTVAALGTLAPAPEAAAELTKLLADPDLEIRREAACALSERGADLDKGRPALEARLGDTDEGTRWWAAVALAAAPGDVRKQEAEILRILRSATYRHAVTSSRGILAVWGSRRAAPALAAILKTRGGPLAVEAAHSLAALDLDVRDAGAELFAALGSNDTMLSRQAAAALATLNVQAMPRLARLLGNENARLRAGAARALGLIGLPARGHAAALTRLLKDGEAPVRVAAALALWDIDADAEAALPALNLVLKDLDAPDRWEAIEGIGIISVEARPPIRGLTEIVVGALKDRDARVRMTAAKWLWRRTRQAKVIVPLVQEGVTDRDPLARLVAVETLGEMGTEPRVVGLLRGALEDRTPVVRLAAVEGLARSVPPDRLLALLADERPRVRLAAVRALGLVGPAAKSSLDALLGVRAKGGEAKAAVDQTIGEIFPLDSAKSNELRKLFGELDELDKEIDGLDAKVKAILERKSRDKP